jgi:hypothetical protein
MLKREEETGKTIKVTDQQGVEFELIEFIELLDEEGFEIEGRSLFRTPGGFEARPIAGKDGKFVVEGSGKILTRAAIPQTEEVSS